MKNGIAAASGSRSTRSNASSTASCTRGIHESNLYTSTSVILPYTASIPCFAHNGIYYQFGNMIDNTDAYCGFIQTHTAIEICNKT